MSKIYDGIIGLAVGDALGVPVEFKKRDTFTVAGMIGYGTHNQPAGTWSDDTSMTLATLESIGRLGEIDVNDIMNNFSKWLHTGEFTPWGEVFDIGNTTYQAIQKFQSGIEALKCGGEDKYSNGNGSLMRILPLAFIPCSMNDINNVSSLTHAHETSKRACRLYICFAEQLLKGKTIKQILSEKDIWVNEFSKIPKLWKCSRDDIKSTGYVVDTLEAALWCLLNGSTYQESVLLAVNLGDDTDTVAAVTGGLAGLIYGCGGEKGIPEEWIHQIARLGWIKGLCDNLDSRFSQ